MTAPLIAPLIPPRARSGVREHSRPATARRLPVAATPEVPAVPDDVMYGFGRMDEPGRVADRAMTSAAGLRPGDRVLLAVFPAETRWTSRPPSAPSAPPLSSR